jgi:outer membrane protein assembly factor BamB
VYLLDYDAKRQADALRCLSLADGGEIWRRWYSITLRSNHGVSRTVPAVTDEFVVTLGPQCHVLCADARGGQAAWSIDLVARYGATVPDWYAGQCPLIAAVGGRPHAILAPGGKKLLVAIDCRTGAETWATPNPEGWNMTHSSPVEVRFAGRRMFIYCFSGGIAGVEADTGRLLWRRTDWKISPANIATPIHVGDGRIVLCGGYNAGGMMFRLRQAGQEITTDLLWRLGKEQFSSYQQTPVFHGGYLYGVLDRDAGPLREQLACLDLTGRHVWTSGRGARFGGGPYILADGKLFLLDDRGLLTVARAWPDGYRPLSQAQVLTGSETWAPLAMAGGRLFVRNMDRMVCLDVRPADSQATLKPTAANGSNRTAEKSSAMKDKSATGMAAVNALVALAIAAAVLVAIVIIARYDWTGTNVVEPPAAVKTGPRLIVADEVKGFRLSGPRAAALAIGPNDRLHVAGQKAVDLYDTDGANVGRIALSDPPDCLAVSDDEKVCVGLAGRVEVYGAGGRKEQSWPVPGKDVQLTSLGVWRGKVAVGVYPAAEVIVFDTTGRVTGRFDGRDGTPGSGFLLRSPYFDLAFDAAGRLHVANPGRFRVETYDAANRRIATWGRAGDAVETFAECCNPVAIAVMPDGRFVTCEKGITRVKIYDAQGRFAGVVAGPEAFLRHDRLARNEQVGDRYALDVAVDSRGHIWVLDPCTRELRRFVLRPPARTRPTP